MELSCQKHLFSLEKNTHYLNCGAYSPLLSKSKYAGIKAVETKANPQQYTPSMHFEGPNMISAKVGELINCEADRVAVIPSVSYGLAVVANNLHRMKDIENKRNIVVLQSSFPNSYYGFERVGKNLHLEMKEFEDSGRVWNESILNSIDDETACVVLPQVHWIYGIIFDLKKISAKCRQHQSLLVIDGTQSVGVFPFDVEEIQPDALVCAGYKWLFGPYSIGFAYFSSFFDDGIPLEESWMNREESDNFSNLTQHQSNYRPLAQRYNMGESSQFILSAIWVEGLTQILNWKVARMQNYISNLQQEYIVELKKLGCRLVADEYRSPHLFGLYLPKGVDTDQFKEKLKENRVYVSQREKGLIRVSVNVFNEELDLKMLVNVLRRYLQKSKI